MTVLAWRRGGSGRGPAVLLLHGLGGAGEDFLHGDWAGELGRAGYEVLVPDLPGHAASAALALPPEAEPAAWTAGVIARDLDELGVADVRLVGYAEGCLAAGHLAARHPERMRPLVLVSRDDRVGVPNGEAVAALLRGERGAVFDTEAADLARSLLASGSHHGPALADWVQRARWPAAPRLGALATPVLLAVGTHDEHRHRAPRLAQLFHDARLVTVPGDERTLLSAPELIEAVVAFLKEHEGEA